MIRDGVLFIVAVVWLLPVNVAAETVIYQDTFDTDPGWITDQPDAFFWDSASSTVSAHFENVPPEPLYAPYQYYVTPTELDPNQDWRLEADLYIDDINRNGVVIFGLFSEDLISSRRSFRSLPVIQSSSTVNLTLLTFNDNSTFFEYTLYETSGVDFSAGGSTDSATFDEKTWYTISITFSHASNTIHYFMKERDTDHVVHDNMRVIPGTTPLVFDTTMKYIGTSLYPQGLPGTTLSQASRPEGSSDFQLDNVTLTQLNNESEPPEPEPLSDLLLQYEPILYFHPDEAYFPMNVEAFVQDSGLWDSTLLDENLIPRNSGLSLSDLATTTDTSNWYINFSSDEAGSFDLAAAKERYEQLVSSGVATSTYYAYETTDSYVDEFGKQHDFIVLQYWYFYAMNNWGQHQPLGNNHEGDWESVFIFLDAATEEPLYAAFSAHHNDGDPSLNLIQYASVRRDWNDAEVLGNKPVSFVSLGSHANYADNGNEGSRFAGLGDDLTSVDGRHYTDSVWNRRESLSTPPPFWGSQYKGFWGSNKVGLGTAGPKGPLFSEVSGINRFASPIEWAGIDRISEYRIEEPVDTLTFTAANVTMRFSEALQAGEIVTVDPYEEFVSFGLNIDEIDLLPRYYDFSTSLPEDSFEVAVTLTYTDEELAVLGLFESELVIWYFNEATDVWEPVDATVDRLRNTITFTTTHFSRYTIGTRPAVVAGEPLEVQYRWGRFDQETGTHAAAVSFKNTTGGTLTEPITLLISDITPDSVTLLGYDDQDSSGYYITVNPEDYGRCFFDVGESQLPLDITQSDKRRILEGRPYSCGYMIEKYYSLEQYKTLGLLTEKFSNPLPLKFQLKAEIQRFKYTADLISAAEE